MTDSGSPRSLYWRATLEQLVLGLVAELALPEPGGPVGHQRGPAGHLAVLPHDLGRLGPGGDPVVPLAGGLGHPAGGGGAQLDPADPGVVPQQAVAAAGHQDRDRHLGVALDQLDDRALLVQPAVLVLAQAVEALVVVGVEQQLEVVGAAAVGPVAPHGRAGEMGSHLGQQLAAVGPEVGDLAGGGDFGGEVAVGDPGVLGRDLDLSGRAGIQGLQRTGEIIGDGAPHRAPYPQAVRAPGF